MEHGIGGRFIPAKLTSKGSYDSRCSSVISGELMNDLKNFVYQHLIDAAESMYSGSIEAVPLLNRKKLYCKYCEFVDICGNGDGTVFRESDADKIKESERLLGKSENAKDKKGGKTE